MERLTVLVARTGVLGQTAPDDLGEDVGETRVAYNDLGLTFSVVQSSELRTGAG